MNRDFAFQRGAHGWDATEAIYIQADGEFCDMAKRTTRRKQSRWKPGMIYAIPLVDGSFGIAQAGKAMGAHVNVIYVAVFADRHLTLPTNPVALSRTSAISLSTTWRQALNRGEWFSLGWAPEVFKKSEFPYEKLAKNGYIGAITSDAGIFSDLLSAYFGLMPWNVMFDPKYFDDMLLPGKTRPRTAVVLSTAARERYRREVLGIVPKVHPKRS